MIRYLTMLAALAFVGCSSSQHGFFPAGAATLDRGNFKVVKTLRAKSQSSYFFGLGEGSQELYTNAHRAIVHEAELDGTRKALIDWGSEVIKTGMPPLFYTKTVNVWATLIEFDRIKETQESVPITQTE